MVSSAVPGPAGSADSTGPHQLARPTLDDAHTALQRLYGPHSEDIWRNLLSRAGLTGVEDDSTSFDRLVSCMNTAEPITRLCGRSLAVRAAAYKHLTADKATTAVRQE
ncbi:hypothetical protein ACWKSP_01030 [Micromonosporaceae bacterium Da 78-11]